MNRYLCTAALFSMAAASPTLADISVDDAWDVWKAQFQAYGLTLEASETRDGDALQIGDIKLSVNFPMGAGSGYLSFTGPRFAPVGDGTVQVSFHDTSRFSFAGEIIGEGSFSASGELTNDGNSKVTMSGNPSEVLSIWQGQEFKARLVDVTIDGEQAVAVSGALNMGPYMLRRTTRTSENQISIGEQGQYGNYTVDYTIELPNGTSKSTISAAGFAQDITVQSAVSLPIAGLDVLGLHSQLRDGVAFNTRVTAKHYGSSQTTRLNGETIADQTTNAEGYDVVIALDQSGLEYGGTTGKFSGGGMVPGLPSPVALAGESVDFRLFLPLLKSDAMQQVALKMALNEVTIDEGLWAMFDPTAQLPRDPMTIAFDLGAEASLLFEFLDIRAMMGGAKPAGLPLTADRVTLNSLTLSGAGAELTGTGDFTLDYTDWVTFDGMPAPEGTAAFMLKGGNGLIDKLIAMGLMSEEDAMGARMMMGLFAKPGEGEDVLTSEIDVKKTGEVSANGQRLR